MNTKAAPWFYAYRNTPFPVATLPPKLVNCIDWWAARYRLNADAVAPLVLAYLAGVLVENPDVIPASGTSVLLPFSVIVVAPDDLGLSAALSEISGTLAVLQQAKLAAAAKLDARYEKKLLSTPVFKLPDYALPPGGLEPGQAGEARAHALHVARHPLFWLESPGSRELRSGFAASFDRTLLVTFSHNGLLEKLLAPKRDRETNRLGDLLSRLQQGSQIEYPAPAKPQRESLKRVWAWSPRPPSLRFTRL